MNCGCGIAFHVKMFLATKLNRCFNVLSDLLMWRCGNEVMSARYHLSCLASRRMFYLNVVNIFDLFSGKYVLMLRVG